MDYYLSAEEQKLSDECRKLAGRMFGGGMPDVFVTRVSGGEHFEAQVADLQQSLDGDGQYATARPAFSRVGSSKLHALTLLRDALLSQGR